MDSIAGWCVQPEDFFNELRLQSTEKARLRAMRQHRQKSEENAKLSLYSDERSVFSLAHSAYQLRRLREAAQVAMDYWFENQPCVVSKFHAINYDPKLKCDRADLPASSTSLAAYNDMIAGRLTAERDLPYFKQTEHPAKKQRFIPPS